jgi:L-lactate permease
VNKFGAVQFVFNLVFYQMFPEITTASTQYGAIMWLSVFTTIVMFLVLMNLMIALMGNIQSIERGHEQRNRLIY